DPACAGWSQRMNLKLMIALLFAIPLVAQTDQSAKPRADVIFLHGNIYTGTGGTSSFGVAPRAQAIAVRGDRIQAIGSDEQILALKGPDTKLVDLGGHFVMPGFNDAHLHLAEAGFQKLPVAMTGVRSLTEFRERLQARVATAAPREWILGGGWDETKWPVKTLPSRWDLDEVTTDHPVFLERTDGHIAVANTRA